MTPLYYFLALFVALWPRRTWEDWDLPVANVALASSLITLLSGAAVGITGFFTHMQAAIPADVFMPPPLMLAVFLGYVFATPRGLFALYLAITGLYRSVSWYIGEPVGDPLLTALDALFRRARTTHRERGERRTREALEGADEPDRRYDGAWAGLTGVDFVIVAARRKPGWTKGTYVITGDDWYVLGEPFDRPMPQGVRTVYPLTRHTSLEVLRKGVSYELPPLRTTPPRKPSTDFTDSTDSNA